MNIKLLVKELEMSEEEFKQHLDLVTKLRALSETERELLMTALEPQKPAAKKSSKKAGKSRGVDRCIYVFPVSGARCNLMADKAVHTEKAHPDYHIFYTGKSARASGMAAAIRDSLQRGRQATTTLCAYVSDNGDDPTECGEPESSGIHDMTMGYQNYHSFVSPASPASSAPPPSDQASSEIGKGAAGDVHRVAGSGD